MDRVGREIQRSTQGRDVLSQASKPDRKQKKRDPIYGLWAGS